MTTEATVTPPPSIVDGYLVNPDTGEILGVATEPEAPTDAPELVATEPLLVLSDRDAALIAKRAAYAKAEIVAALTMKERATARMNAKREKVLLTLAEDPEFILAADASERADAAIKRATDRLEFLKANAFDALKDWVKKKLEKKKTRFVDFDFGRVQLRKKSAKVEIPDELERTVVNTILETGKTSWLRYKPDKKAIAEAVESWNDEELAAYGLTRRPESDDVDVVVG